MLWHGHSRLWTAGACCVLFPGEIFNRRWDAINFHNIAELRGIGFRKCFAADSRKGILYYLALTHIRLDMRLSPFINILNQRQFLIDVVFLVYHAAWPQCKHQIRDQLFNLISVAFRRFVFENILFKMKSHSVRGLAWQIEMKSRSDYLDKRMSK